MARAIYHREARRDPGDGRPRATWDELNQGRRATRLNYADELLSVLFGALGLGWDEVDAIRVCAKIAREARGGAEVEDVREEADPGADTAGAAEAAERAAEVMAALLPRRLGS